MMSSSRPGGSLEGLEEVVSLVGLEGLEWVGMRMTMGTLEEEEEKEEEEEEKEEEEEEEQLLLQILDGMHGRHRLAT